MSNFGVRRFCRRFSNLSRNERRIAEQTALAVRDLGGAAALRPTPTNKCPCYDPSLHSPKLKTKN
jgi:hypothetical protein